MGDDRIPLPDGRSVGLHDLGPADGTPVLWCLGGPGSRIEPAAMAPGWRRPTWALLADPEFATGWTAGLPEMFAYAVAGYTDDRRADGPGWGSFDVSGVTCPVIIVHGGADTIVPVANAHHTAALVPHAVLRILPEHGHLSVVGEVGA